MVNVEELVPMEDLMPLIKEVLSSGDVKVIGGKTFLAISSQNHPDSAIFVDGNDENAASFARLISISLGGTSVLILVGVALDTVNNLESQMMMRHYKGFLD